MDSTLEDEWEGRARPHRERDSMRLSPSFFNNAPANPKALLATALLPPGQYGQFLYLLYLIVAIRCHPQMML